MNFEKLGNYIDSLYEKLVPGCDLIVYREHQEIYRHMAGYRDEDRTLPMQGDEAYCLYSCTKVLTTCAVMQLIGEGRIRLDDPVSCYLPAFGEMRVMQDGKEVPARRVMTIRHLMSMQSGMDYELDAPQISEVIRRTQGHASTAEVVEALAERPLQFEPGTDFLYSFSHDVLGAVIEAVTHMSFSEYLKQHIFDPLEMPTIGFTLKEKDLPRLCAQYEYQDDTQDLKHLPGAVDRYRLTDRYESGGAGLISDVHDYITFLDAVACGGIGKNGAAVLPPEMIQLWSANQLETASRRSFDEWNRVGYSYGLGVRTRVDLEKGGPGTIGEFGWDGAAGSWAMIDPHRHVSAFFAMHVKNYGYTYDVIHPRIRTLIYEGLD